MKVAVMFQDIHHVGQTEGDRNTYDVFRGENQYLIVSPARSGGYYVNLVSSESIDVIAKAFRGQKVTSRLVRAKGRRPDLFDSSLRALNSLYVMSVLRRARKLKQRDGKSIVFKVK